MPIGEKEWIAVHDGHEIRVVNTWFQGARLYVDGQLCSENTDLFSISNRTPILATTISTCEGRSARLEVFIVAILTTKARICVNGRQIGGNGHRYSDDFKKPAIDPRVVDDSF